MALDVLDEIGASGPPPHDGWRSRKLWLTLLLIVIASAALFADKLTGAQWVEVVTWLLGLFGAANVAEKTKWTKSS